MTFTWTAHRFAGGALALDVANSIVLRFDPERRIDSYIAPKGTLTKRGMANWDGRHADEYAWFEGGTFDVRPKH